jgi:hypothetical protein
MNQVKSKRQRQAKNIRTFRKIHRTTGIFLFVFFIIVSLSGILLGWKKHSGEIIIPKTYIGTSNDLKKWLSLDELHIKADNILSDSVSTELPLELDRIDIRKDKGTVKFIYANDLWEIQLDAATGKLLNIGKRNSDLIENIHDGSILDSYFGTSNGQIKLIYTTIMGTALLLFSLTGFWIWYGPKRMRKSIKS